MKISKGKKKHLKYIAIPVVLIIAASALCFVFLKRNSTEHTLGDVNFDGKIDASDSSCVLSYYASLATKKLLLLQINRKNVLMSTVTVLLIQLMYLLYFIFIHTVQQEMRKLLLKNGCIAINKKYNIFLSAFLKCGFFIELIIISSIFQSTLWRYSVIHKQKRHYVSYLHT